jgi:hypothetical protein
MNMREQEILQTATETLASLTGAQINSRRFHHGPDRGSDGSIEIKLNNKKETFEVTIKNELRRNNFPVSLITNGHNALPHLLISQYIPMPLKQELKRREVNYLETAGNCFIRTPDIFIYINDQQVTDNRIPAEGKIWKAAGLKFLFVVLRFPDLLNNSYRGVAEEAGIALGSIGGLLEELVKEGFLKVKSGAGRKMYFIENRNRLIERWAEAYRANLRPKEMIGNFRFIDKETAKSWDNLEPIGFKWGGENAGALLTQYLQPEKFTLYVTENRLELMRRLKLVPDPTGNVEVLQQFWPDTEADTNDSKTVPPLLVYADLITSFDSRNRQTADRIKTQYLD